MGEPPNTEALLATVQEFVDSYAIGTNQQKFTQTALNAIASELERRRLALVEAARHQGLPEDAEPERIAQHFRGNRETAEGFRQIAAEAELELVQAELDHFKATEDEIERVRAERDAAQVALNEHGRYVLTSGQLDEAEAQVDTLQRLAERTHDALVAAEAELERRTTLADELRSAAETRATQAELELERVRAERDAAQVALLADTFRTKTRLDRAVEALREIEGMGTFTTDQGLIARAALAEIEEGK